MSILDNIPLLGGESESESNGEAAEELQEEIENASDGEDVYLSSDATFFVPEETHIYRDKIVSDGTHFRSFVVDDWPPRLKQDIFAKIIKSANLDFDFTLHLEPYDDQEAVDKLESLASKLNDKRDGEFARFTSNKESMANTEQTLSAMKQHITQGEKLFDVSFYITLRAQDGDQLERHTDELKNKLEREARLGLNECRYQQQKALISNSPAGVNALANENDGFKQLMLSSAVARTFPFMEDTFMESNGVLFGINENSMTPVFLDIFARSNGYNQLTTGMVGSGKSFSTSQVLLEMERAYTDFQQFIIDPMGGFLGVNNALDGDRILIGGDESINPMEIKETPKHVMERAQGKLDPWGMKKQELRWFFTEFFNDRGDGLSGDELSTLDQAITQTYNRKGITKDVETHSNESPTILDLIETLRMMAEDASEFSDTTLEEEAEMRKNIAISLVVKMDPFKEGGEYHNLAQETEIDISSGKTVYLDLQQIPEHSDNMGIMMQLVFMKIYQNAKTTEDKVAITIDEAHKIMGDDNITGGLEELFRHSRHFDLSINLISQTPEEFYKNQTAETIAKQCTIKRFHRVDSLDKDLAEEKLELNDREISFIENAEMGEGDKDYSEALLVIQDEDRSIPLRIEATKDEQTVIGYDPTDSIQDFDTKSEQRLKHALDVYNQNDNPVFIDDEDELAAEVRSQIVKKRRNRRRMIAEEDPSLLTKKERQQISGEGAEGVESGATNGGAPTGVDQPRNSANGQSTNVGDNSQEEQEASARTAIKNSLDGPDGVRDLPERDVRNIATQYGLKEEGDDIVDMRDKIIEDFFGVSATSSEEEDTQSEGSKDVGDGAPDSPSEDIEAGSEEVIGEVDKILEDVKEGLGVDSETTITTPTPDEQNNKEEQEASTDD